MYSFFKRTLDIIISGSVLLVFAPIFLVIMLLLKLTGEGEVFYFQKRLGFKNKIFDIWKFATMLKNSPNMGTGDITMRNDPRVTSMGRFLRKTKLNEFPQIVNVLLGDMSIVGPRPLMPVSFKMYDEHVQSRVYDSKPGITGIGSIIFRDEETLVSETDMDPREYYETVIYPYKGALELWYQENKSMTTDIKLICLTAWVILFPNSDLPNRVFKDLPKRTQIKTIA